MKKEEKQVRALKRAVSTRAPAKPEGAGSFVVTCPCGHRLRIQVSPFLAEAHTSSASSAAITEPVSPAAISSSAAPPAEHEHEDEHEHATVGASARLEDSAVCPSEPIQRNREDEALPQHAPSRTDEPGVSVPPVATAEQALVPEAPASEAPTSEAPPSDAPISEAPASEAPTSEVPTFEVPAPAEPVPAPRLRTYELYAEQRGVPLLLDEALFLDGTRWLPRSGVRIQLGERPEEGFGLAGSPGRWSDAYGDRSPSRFGHGERWAVMYVIERRRQRLGVVVPVEMLRTLLGERWRELLGEMDSP